MLTPLIIIVANAMMAGFLLPNCFGAATRSKKIVALNILAVTFNILAVALNIEVAVDIASRCAVGM